MALNESTQLEREVDKAITSSKTYYGQVTTHPNKIRKYDFYIGMTQETIETIEPNDTMIPNDILKIISEIAHDQLIASIYTSPEDQSRFRNNSRNCFDLSHSPSRSRFGGRPPRWNNEYPRTNPSLRNMSCIVYGR